MLLKVRWSQTAVICPQRAFKSDIFSELVLLQSPTRQSRPLTGTWKTQKTSEFWLKPRKRFVEKLNTLYHMRIRQNSDWACMHFISEFGWGYVRCPLLSSLQEQCIYGVLEQQAACTYLYEYGVECRVCTLLYGTCESVNSLKKMPAVLRRGIMRLKIQNGI